MAAMPEESIDAIVSDPPYGLEFMGKEWDSFRGGAGFSKFGFSSSDSLPAPTYGKGTDAMRAFQNWVSLWAVEAFRILKPGGHVLAFGGTRTYHRLACGLEEVGFEIRDSLHWIYGSGFPKSLDVSLAIDNAAGLVRGDRGEARIGTNKVLRPTHHTAEKGTPVAEEARVWAGWGTGLKPAHEPIVLARKPLAGTVAETVMKYGTGALNIEGARVGFDGGTKGGQANDNWRADGTNVRASVDIESIDAGRWPANILLAHLADCKGSGANHTDVLCADGCPVAELNEMSGETESTSSLMPLPRTPGDSRGGKHGDRERETVRGHNDSGGAARFFYIAKPRKREKIGGTVRNLHPCLLPGELVLTDEGYEPIESVGRGRLVYADDGRFHPVDEAFSSPCDGPVYEIGVDGTNLTTTATGNHPFLAWRTERRQGTIVGGSIGWTRADELEPGDYLLTPVSRLGRTSSSHPPSWWFAAGLWCAEGSVHTNQHGGSYASYAIGKGKEHLIERLRSVSRLGVYPRGDSLSHVVLFQKGLVDEFVELVHRRAVDKRIRPAVLEADEDSRRAFLDGYASGDGCVIRDSRRFKTASLRLASTLPLLIESLGVRSSMYRHDGRNGRPATIDGREIKQGIYFQLYPLDRSANSDRPKRPTFVEHDGARYSVRRVKEVTEREYVGPVWNITVRDRHTFQTAVGMSHNTVKPIDLMRMLVRLVTPPGGVVLDPFLGSGTTGCAAMVEGFRFVGIELDPESYDTSLARISDYAFAYGRDRPVRAVT